jgi:hypothetical protein
MSPSHTVGLELEGGKAGEEGACHELVSIPHGGLRTILHPHSKVWSRVRT